jgi:hypothetical protein
VAGGVLVQLQVLTVMSLLHSRRCVILSRASLHLEIIALRHQLAGPRSSAPPASPFDASRSHAIGVALTLMARLALGRTHRQAGNRHRVAPTQLSSLLDLEKSTSNGPSGRASLRSRPDSRALDRESSLGRAVGSRGVAEVGDLGESVDARQVHAAASGPSHKRGGPSSRTTRTRSWLLTCSSCRLSPSGSCSYSSCWDTTVDGSSTWPSPSIPRRLGPLSSFGTPSPVKRPGYLVHDRDAVFREFATTVAAMNIQAVRLPRDRRGRTPTWNASSARSDVSASTTSSW